MEVQDLYLSKYDWSIRVFYNATYRNTASIVEHLERNNYSEATIDAVYSSMSTMGYDSGMTVVDKKRRLATLVISKATCPSEFFNTLIHELNHLSDFIAEANGISASGETISYMIGNIGMLMFPRAGKFLCH